MNERHSDLTGILGGFPALGEVILRFHQLGRNGYDLNLVNTGNLTFQGGVVGLQVQRPRDLFCVLDNLADSRRHIQDSPGCRYPGIIHDLHKAVELFQDVGLRQIRGGFRLARLFPVCKNLRNGVAVHFREFLLVIVDTGDILDRRHLVSLVNIRRVYQGRPFTLISQRFRLPGVVIVTGGRLNGIPVGIHTAGRCDGRNLNGLCVDPLETSVVGRRVQSTKVQDIREILLQRLLIVYCIV